MKGLYEWLVPMRGMQHCSVTLSGCCRVCRAQLRCCSQWTVTVQCTVQWRVQCTVLHGLTTKRFSPWSTVCSLASKDEAISPERVAQAWPQWLQTTTLIKVRVISARENIYCCGDMLELYFQRYFSLLIFCLNILVRKAHEKWGHRV